jgi:hypothetical protein
MIPRAMGRESMRGFLIEDFCVPAKFNRNVFNGWFWGSSCCNFRRIARGDGLNDWWNWINVSMAKCLEVGSSSTASVSVECRPPIVTAFCWEGRASITMGDLLSLQVVGQRDRARRGFFQSTSGLWARSQSVPKMISWSPNDVT